MKLALQLAYRNLIGAGLRTWLNVAVLSFTFIIIIFFNGLLQGWHNQAKEDTINWEYGYGQLLVNSYDPFDAFTIQDGHSKIPETIENATPLLIRQGTIYPDGRMVPILLKGIESSQTLLKIPTETFKNTEAAIPAIIGNRMAIAANLKIGDQVLLRWRDKYGTFDAANIAIVYIFDSTVPSIDSGQIWLPIKKLRQMTDLLSEATLFVVNENFQDMNYEGWNFKTQNYLLKDIEDVIKTEAIGSALIYLVLFAIALLAIFDTQVLSIFRRQKEIGTYIAMGMTRKEVVTIFTVEGAMYSIFAVVVGSIYGIPILGYLAYKGISMPSFADGFGISIPKTMYPYFSIEVVLLTILLVIIASTIVSFLPARKIAKMNPVLALKGKLQ